MIKLKENFENIKKVKTSFEEENCETKVWLILILMITKQGLELMIIFQV